MVVFCAIFIILSKVAAISLVPAAIIMKHEYEKSQRQSPKPQITHPIKKKTEIKYSKDSSGNKTATIDAINTNTVSKLHTDITYDMIFP